MHHEPQHHATRGDRRGADPRLIAALGTAAALGALAWRNAAAARRAERENPPGGHFLEAGGVRLHYLARGEGDAPPVVLLHGNAVRAEDWVASGVFDLLARRRRVIAFDRPGYGFSERPRDRIWGAEAQAEVLAEAFQRLGIERPVVVGHSWGALVAVALGLDFAGAVSGLVLASGYHYPTARADVAVFSPPALPVVGDVVRYTVGPLAGALIAPPMIRRMFQPLPVPARFEAAVPVPMMLRPWQIRASAEDAATMTPRAASVRSRYAELGRMPVAILAGSEDRIVDVGRHSARLHGDVPGSTLRVVPGVGHMVHHAARELVAEVVDEVSGTADAPLLGAAPAVPLPA